MSPTAKVIIALAVGMLAAATVACAGGAEGGPTPPPDTPAMREVLAPIESVDIRIAESYPPQYFLHVVSGLRNSCVRFDRYELERDGTTLRVTVINLEPTDPDILCAQVYRTVEHNIALGTDFEPGVEYTVVVNDVSRTFRAQ